MSESDVGDGDTLALLLDSMAAPLLAYVLSAKGGLDTRAVREGACGIKGGLRARAKVRTARGPSLMARVARASGL